MGWRVAVFGCGGFLMFSTYIAPMTTEVTGWPPAAVPVMLGLLGLGMTAGTFLGGRLADRMDSLRAAVVLLGAQAVVLFGAVAAVHSRVLAPVAAFAVGALSLALVPVVQTVVVDAAREAPVLASASMQSGFNIANALGAALGGLVLAAGLGYAAPPAVGAVLAAVGVGIAVVARRRAGCRADLGRSRLRSQCPTDARPDLGKPAASQTARAVVHLVGPAHPLCRVRDLTPCVMARDSAAGQPGDEYRRSRLPGGDETGDRGGSQVWVPDPVSSPRQPTGRASGGRTPQSMS